MRSDDMNDQGLPTITLRVGVFFDGTGNNQSNSPMNCVPPSPEQTAQGGSYINSVTNIGHLYDRYERTIGALPTGSREAFLKLYVEGIATKEGQPDSTYSWYTGMGEWGVRARAEQAAKSLAEQLQAALAERQVKVAGLMFDLFGFSRGAAAARHFANDLLKAGDSLLAQALSEHSALFVADFDWQSGLSVSFVGLFDTVAAIVDPIAGDFSPANEKNDNLQLGLDATFEKVVQLVAGDEHRVNYPLVRTSNDIVLPGCHADVGGGYPLRMTEKAYLSKPFYSNVDSDTPAQDTDAYASAAALLAAEYADCPGYEPLIEVTEQPRLLDALGKQVSAVLYREREVLGHLALIHLEVMHTLAVAAGVPLVMPGQVPQCLHLPAELEDIARKVHAYADGSTPELGLSDDQRHLLRARYIHTSANWNPGLGVELLPGDLLYFNRPAEGGRKVQQNR
ncbi:T6SS phospholipase effector Tle1-like catalytic domain-containing protein [Pseudomonas sp. NPDC089554]|uniref:T6SS phospholipase effector Tle1-like catalytic domain-containing protein n=1 Tax=Pseudomonas sp. NPDC089554 TaxID=3390653 RepID=UPI003D065EAC